MLSNIYGSFESFLNDLCLTLLLKGTVFLFLKAVYILRMLTLSYLS